MTEIERRWLVAEVPAELPAGRHIVQGYLTTTPVALRVRRWDDHHTLNLKSGAGLRRLEIEREIDATEFDELYRVADELRIDKHRHVIDLGGGLHAELDLFHGDLEGCRIVEVEFSSVEDADAFAAPAWFGREVTDDDRYTNAALARHGWPDG